MVRFTDQQTNILHLNKDVSMTEEAGSHRKKLYSCKIVQDLGVSAPLCKLTNVRVYVCMVTI